MIVIVFPLNEKPLIAFLLQKTTSDFQLGLVVVMILPQVHLRKPCYDFTFL